MILDGAKCSGGQCLRERGGFDFIFFFLFGSTKRGAFSLSLLLRGYKAGNCQILELFV